MDIAASIGRFVSADGHANEPTDLWVTRMDRRFRERAPRIEKRADADYFVAEGIPEFAMEDLLGSFANEKAEGRQIIDRSHNRAAQMRLGADDPKARLADQDLDNLRAEVCYPNHGLFLMALPDADYRRECFRVYNDWIIEYCSVDPNRLLSVGMLPIGGPIDWAISEAQRMAKRGIRSFLLPSGKTKIAFGDPYYQPLWPVLEEIGLPLAFHIVASDNIEENYPSVTLEMGGPWFASTCTKLAAPMHTVAGLIGSGVAQAHPGLRFVMVESGFGWVAAHIGWLDKFWEDHHYWAVPKLDERPSFYLKRQFYFTFEADRAGLLTRELLNIERLMWGSDYPHTEGTFPRSREQIARDFSDLPIEQVRRLVRDNAAELYGC